MATKRKINPQKAGRTQKVITKEIPIQNLQLNSGQIKGIPKNPRFIKDERFELLKNSIQENPEMLQLRELIVYENKGKFVILGGNMRFRAMKDLGFSSAICKIIPPETNLKSLKSYIIKDNVSYGEMDWQLINEDWDLGELKEWGIDVSDFTEIDYSGKNKEIDVEDFQNEMVLKLKFTKEDYILVEEKILELKNKYKTDTNEETLIRILNLHEKK